jgi:hypothetical protein
VYQEQSSALFTQTHSMREHKVNGHVAAKQVTVCGVFRSQAFLRSKRLCSDSTNSALGSQSSLFRRKIFCSQRVYKAALEEGNAEVELLCACTMLFSPLCRVVSESHHGDLQTSPQKDVKMRQ